MDDVLIMQFTYDECMIVYSELRVDHLFPDDNYTCGTAVIPPLFIYNFYKIYFETTALVKRNFLPLRRDNSIQPEIIFILLST